MATFGLGYIKNKEDWKGIFLRIDSPLNKKIFKKIEKSGELRFFETIQSVSIERVLDNDEVLLEVWAKSIFDIIKGKGRHNVFLFRTKVDLEWSCEGNYGKGQEILEK